MKTNLNFTLASAAGLLAMLCAAPSQAVNIADAPVFFSILVNPNLMVVVDDSTSMGYDWLPEELGNMIPSEDREKAYYLYSPQINHQYYNPNVTYTPWYNYKGGSCLDVDINNVPTAADGGLMMCQKSTGDGGISGITIDLTQPNEHYFKATQNLPGYWVYQGDPAKIGSQGADGHCPRNHSGDKIGYPASNPNVCLKESYNLVQLNANDQLQNFANWFVYYRTRGDVASAAIGKAISDAFIVDSKGVAINALLRMGVGMTTYTGTTDTGNNNMVDFGGTVKLGVQQFTVIDPDTKQVDTSIRKKLLYDNIYSPSWNGSSDLTRALDDVGHYFMQAGADGPWKNDPPNEGASQLECRRNYQVLLTDGNLVKESGSSRDAPRTTAGNADSDMEAPHKDDWSNTVADYAAYYWKNDLRPDMADTLSKSNADKAIWQHLNTYTVGLGEFGHIVPATDAKGNSYNLDGTPILPDPVAWLDPQNDAAAKLDDIWHAAIDGRGGYYNAKYIPANKSDPLGQALSNMRNPSVLDVTASLTSLAYNNLPPGKGGVLYQARFRTADWSGQLLAYPLDSNANIQDKNGDGIIDERDALWDAEAVLADYLAAPDAYLARKVYSYGWNIGDDCRIAPGAGAFDIGSPEWNCWQYQAFDPTGIETYDLIYYLKGDSSKEQPKGKYRSRTVVIDGASSFRPLGDIVNSDPLYIGNTEDFGYSSLPEGDPSKGDYQKFLGTVKKNRQTMVYFGANDGMLHGIATDKGDEVFAYVPGAIVSSNLSARADPKFLHKYLVDGSPAAGDAYFSGAWHTILLGTTGAGAKSIFALDVTDPKDFSNLAKGVTKVLWEFTNNDFQQDDPDLGYTISKPKLVRLQNGSWGVILGNGYNSTGRLLHDSDGQAVLDDNGNLILESLPVLYVLDISKQPGDAGFILKKFSPCDNDFTHCPKLGDKVGRDNGMSTPIVVDVNGDRRADYVYAGDLMGNVWKFDLTCPSDKLDTPACADSWDVANGGKPLFTACVPGADADCKALGDRQPITSKPQVGGVNQVMAKKALDLATKDGVKANTSVLVYVGTGKYLDHSDVNPPPPTQSFYGLWDLNLGDISYDNSITGRSELKQQNILLEEKYGNFMVRVTSNNTPCYSGKDSSGNNCDLNKGWYMDLVFPADKPQGERAVGFPLLLNGNIVFTTIIPSYDNCLAGGTGWLMELNAYTGARPSSPPFDLYGAANVPDNMINSYDLVPYDNSGNVPPSGRKSEVGMAPGQPAVVPGNGVMNKFLSGSTGKIDKITDPGFDTGRMSWGSLR